MLFYILKKYKIHINYELLNKTKLKDGYNLYLTLSFPIDSNIDIEYLQTYYPWSFNVHYRKMQSDVNKLSGHYADTERISIIRSIFFIIF